MNTLRIAVIGCGVLLAAASASAHHSFSAEFDIEKPITLHGTLTELEWVNPHGWLHIDVEGPDGKVVNWAVEMGNPTGAASGGAAQGALSRRIEFIVAGYPAKDAHPNQAASTKSRSRRARVLFRSVGKSGCARTDAEA